MSTNGGETEKKEDDRHLEKFMGRKERRRSSLNKPLQGDYIGAKTNNKILSIIGFAKVVYRWFGPATFDSD